MLNWNFLKNPGKTLLGSTARSPYRTQQAGAATALGGQLPAYSALRNRGTTGIGMVAPQRQGAFNQAINYLQNDYGGDALDSMRLAGAYGRNANARDAGAARLGTQFRRRGISGGAEAGALAANEGNAMRANSAANIDVAQAGIDRNRQNQLTALGLARDEENYYNNLERQGLAGEAGVYNQQFNQFGNLAQQDEARQAASQNRFMNLISGGASLFGNLSGASRVKKPQTVQNLYGYTPVDDPNLFPDGGGNIVQGPDGQYYIAEEY